MLMKQQMAHQFDEYYSDTFIRLYQKIKSRNYDSAFYFVNLNTTQP